MGEVLSAQKFRMHLIKQIVIPTILSYADRYGKYRDILFEFVKWMQEEVNKEFGEE